MQLRDYLSWIQNRCPAMYLGQLLLCLLSGHHWDFRPIWQLHFCFWQLHFNCVQRWRWKSWVLILYFLKWNVSSGCHSFFPLCRSLVLQSVNTYVIIHRKQAVSVAPKPLVCPSRSCLLMQVFVIFLVFAGVSLIYNVVLVSVV